MAEPVFRSPIPEPGVDLPGVRLTDESDLPKWRTWTDPGVPLGRAAARPDGGLALAVAPGEWILLGGGPGEEAVDLTHVRAALRLTGPGARPLLERVCALDLSDEMTPDGAAARTLVAGVATEIARTDRDGQPSYLLLMSRSFAAAVHERLVAAGTGA